jgi:membrane protease YdiL (CAAX protease family)
MTLFILFFVGPAIIALLGLVYFLFWLERNDYLQLIFPASLPSIFIALLGVYAYSVGNISFNNLTLLFIGVTVGTAASIFRSKKILIENHKKSQDSKE